MRNSNIGHLYLLGEDLRMDTKETPIRTRLNYVAQNMLTILRSVVNMIMETYITTY